jgi:hypothetical protein
MPSVDVGQIYVVRCVEAGQEDWRRLLIAGQVPSRPGEPTTEWTVQQPGVELETRSVATATLIEDCDLELPL